MRKIFKYMAFFTVLTLCGCGQQTEKPVSENEISTVQQTSSTSETTTSVTTKSSKETSLTTITSKSENKSKLTSMTELTTAKITSVSTKKSTNTESSGGDTPAPTEELVIVEPDVGQVEEPPVVETPVPETPSYDEDIYNKLGIQVNLSGSNEEQAQQYYEACKAAYPSLPWYYTGTGAGIDVWSMSDEEIDAMINERLAGRDYHELSLEELYNLMELTGPTAFGSEIFNYFIDLTHRDFNNGGYVIAQ